MSVDDWARDQAEKRYPATWQDRGRTDRDDERDAFKEGVSALADALLSDEAMEAAARQYWALPNWERLTKFDRARQVVFMRAALQAAVDAVTKEARND